MPLQASTDRELDRTGTRQREQGSRLLLLGGVVFAVGLLFMTLFDSNVPVYVGVALAALAAPPTLGGLGLWLSGLVSARASKHKPFA